MVSSGPLRIHHLDVSRVSTDMQSGPLKQHLNVNERHLLRCMKREDVKTPSGSGAGLDEEADGW